MNALKIAALIAVGMVAGCMAAGPPLTAQSVAPTAVSGDAVHVEFPLLLDRADLRIGTTVQFHRIPDAGEINDLRQVRALAHVVLSLDAWPSDITRIEALGQVPLESDIVVILPGYPPSRSAAEVWNYLEARVRLVMLVDGPPPSSAVTDDLNNMRHLERVIAQMDDPARTGFDRLQRPLSFRKLIR